MKLDIKGIGLLASLEGLKLKAYKCPAGVWTIGLGNTFYEDGSKVKESDIITKEEAYHLFQLVKEKFENAINIIIVPVIPQNKFNALFCLCYNIGKEAYAKSTLAKLVNANPNDGMIAKEFLKWNKIDRKANQ